MLRRAVLFNTNDDLIASNNPEWLQGAFETPTGLLNRVRLWTNVGKTVGMI